MDQDRRDINPLNLDIQNLADVPEHLITVGEWIYKEWWRGKATLDQIVDRLKRHSTSIHVPFTLVALHEKLPVGTASIIEHDLEIREQYSPWLAAVYVLPEYRRFGIGSQLVRTAMELSNVLGIQTLYLSTLDRQAFYARLGWSIVEEQIGGARTTIMASSCRLLGLSV